MLDIKIFRDNPDIIRKSEKDRYRKTNNVDKVIDLDEKWRNIKREIDDLKKKRNQLSADIGKIKKKDKKADISEIQNEVLKIKEDTEKKEKKAEELLAQRDVIRYKIGNIIHESVPIGKTGEKDEVIRTWGKQKSFSFIPKGHADLVEFLDIANLTKAAEVSGSRTYYLKNELVFLNFALAQFAMDYLVKQGFWFVMNVRKKNFPFQRI